MYYRQRKGLGMFGQPQLGRTRRTVAQAPIVGGYNDGNMKTTLRADPKMPIEQRLATIQEKVRSSIQDPEMRKLALQITAQCPERDGMCEAKAIYDWIKANIRYTGDIAPVVWEDGSVEGVDLYQSARRTVEFGGGDCDDQGILGATLLSANGITARLRVVRSRGAPDWEHIFPGALLPKGTGDKFVAIDTTLPGNNNFGVEPPYSKSIDFDA